MPSWVNWPILISTDQTCNIIDWQTLFTWLWIWLTLRLSKRQSPTTVLFRTTLTRTIIQYELLVNLSSNHLVCYSEKTWREIFTTNLAKECKEWFSSKCCKFKAKEIPLANHEEHRKPIKTSKPIKTRSNTCTWRKARENECEIVTIEILCYIWFEGKNSTSFFYTTFDTYVKIVLD